jgi:hypothetical protein
MVDQCGLPGTGPGNDRNDVDIFVCPCAIQESDTARVWPSLRRDPRQAPRSLVGAGPERSGVTEFGLIAPLFLSRSTVMAFRTLAVRPSAPETPEKLLLEFTRRRFPTVLPHQSALIASYVSHALNRPDVALQVPTGSGKTLQSRRTPVSLTRILSSTITPLYWWTTRMPPVA